MEASNKRYLLDGERMNFVSLLDRAREMGYEGELQEGRRIFGTHGAMDYLRTQGHFAARLADLPKIFWSKGTINSTRVGRMAGREDLFAFIEHSRRTDQFRPKAAGGGIELTYPRSFASELQAKEVAENMLYQLQKMCEPVCLVAEE